MNNDELKILLKSKGYSDSLIDWAIKFYPVMCDYFGYENTIKFFNEYNLIPRDKIGSNSGATYKDKKIISFDWQMKNFHEALTLFIHEAAHAIGGLEISYDKMIMEGHKYRESFLAKLEEGFVSDKQNEMEYGELNYTYVTINTFDDKDEFHKNDFKTQPSHKYTINNVYYRALQLLLGVNNNLLYQSMFAGTKEEKEYYYNNAISFLKEQLEDEFLILIDCVCTLTLNYSYHGDTVNILDYLRNSDDFKSEESKKDYISRLKEEFPKNFLYAEKRDLFGKSIFDSVDDLCLLTLNVLINRLENNEYDSFFAIKEACIYFTKISNNSDKLTEKTNELQVVLLKKVNELFPQLTNIDIKEYNMTEDDMFKLITQIISLSKFSDKNCNVSFSYSNKDNLLKFLINDSDIYSIKKVNIYSDEEISFGTPIPIGYDIVLQKDEILDYENVEKIHKTIR